MRTFQDKKIPDGVHFQPWLFEDPSQYDSLITDSKVTCNTLCNVETSNDVLGLHEDPKCAGLSCCDCVFWCNNTDDRLAYWNKLTAVKEVSVPPYTIFLKWHDQPFDYCDLVVQKESDACCVAYSFDQKLFEEQHVDLDDFADHFRKRHEKSSFQWYHEIMGFIIDWVKMKKDALNK